MTDQEKAAHELALYQATAHKDLLALYHVTTQDLAFFKAQQWTLTNYTLLAFAAAVGISELPGQGAALGGCGRFILCFVSTVVCLGAAKILKDLHVAIKERRDRLDRIIPSLSETFREARGPKPPRDEIYMTLFLIWLLVVGFGYVLWLFLFSHCSICCGA